jgi:hypothetical protein
VCTKVHSYDYIPVARIWVNTNHKYRFWKGVLNIMLKQSLLYLERISFKKWWNPFFLHYMSLSLMQRRTL